MNASLQIDIPQTRVDRAQLRKPVVRDDGTKIYEAVLAVADKPLVYDWGIEIPTREALSNPDYLEALRGISVVEEHPEAARIDGQAPAYGEGRRLGSTISARFDAESGEVLVEIAIPEVKDQKMIESHKKELSEGYMPTLETRGDDVFQIGRKPNHIAVTARGRAPTRIRVDAFGGQVVDLEQMMAFLALLDAKVDKIMAILSPVPDNGIDSERDMVDAAAYVLGDEVRGDAKKFTELLKNKIATDANALVELKLRADSLGIKLPEAAKDLKSIRKALALALGADEKRSDSEDYCDGVILSARQERQSRMDSDKNTTPYSPL